MLVMLIDSNFNLSIQYNINLIAIPVKFDHLITLLRVVLILIILNFLINDHSNCKQIFIFSAIIIIIPFLFHF